MIMISLLYLLFVKAVWSQASAQPFPCIRYSGQLSTLNDSIYYFGGEATLSPSQTSNLWTNAFLRIDLQNWPIGSPKITLIQADNGNAASPPAVALGALWSNAAGTKLFQFGGEFSDSPNVIPPSQQLFQFDISKSSWSVVPTIGDTVTRPAEGASTLVEGGGSNGENLGYYFSGHIDSHTTADFSDQVPRVYLSSLVSLDIGTLSFTNRSSYPGSGSSSNTSTPEIAPLYRADGSLTFIPRLGTNGKGILVAIGGATETQYVDNSILDVYDIGAGGWTKQGTTGATIGTRVNHCAVRASATVAGVETHQIFIYGGQQLNQSDRDSALYILTLPSFTWISVSNSSSPLPSQPAGRAGHQCAISGSQLIVVGGLVSAALICDQPGIYVYDVSQSEWKSSFTAGTIYTVPSVVSNLTPPTNSTTTASSSSSSASATTGASSSSSSSSNIGAIVGGVVGGIAALLFVLLFVLLARRKRRNRDEMVEGDERRASYSTPERMNSDSTREKRPVSSTFASDDVENETRNMEASFGGSHLVPKRTLRVINNPDEANDE